MAETHRTFCRICEALCGLEVTVQDGRIHDIRPDADHVATKGFACVKGLKQASFYDSSDRLTRPLKKNAKGEHVPISWDQAFEEIGAKVKAIRASSGDDGIGMYVGTAAGFSALHPVFAQGFMQGLGSSNIFSSATQDCANKFAVAKKVYGFEFTLPFPDLDNTGCLIIVGANPVISKWSFLQVPNPAQRLKDLSQRGSDLFVVDPRRTETVKVAGEHIFIRPGTDVFFYLAFLHEVFARDAVDRAKVEAHMTGLEDLKALTAQWSPERCAQVTRIEPQQLRHLVDRYLAATQEGRGAVLYCSTGVNMGGAGALGYWLQETINAVTGNLDARGGSLVGKGIIDFPKFGTKNKVFKEGRPSRVGGFTPVNDGRPGGILADEILTPGPGQIRGMFVTGGNPLITMADAGRLRDAFSQLELLVSVDILLNETATLSDYVLPATSPFQRPDLPFIFPLMLGLQVTPYLQATEAIVAPEGEQRDEATIYTLLAKACEAPIYGSSVAQRLLEWGLKKNKRHPDALPAVPQRTILDLILRLSRQGGFKKLLRDEHGRLRPPHEPASFLGQRVYTDDGKIHLAPEALMAEAGRLEEMFAAEQGDSKSLRLITRRSVKTHNSWTHNDPRFVSGYGGTNHVYVHPKDAEELGLEEGAYADVTSDSATVRVPVALSEDLFPGTVALPHGWGHQHAKGLSVANTTSGVNVNILGRSGPDSIERASGMSRMTGIPVKVSPAAGSPNPRSWSGLP